MVIFTTMLCCSFIFSSSEAMDKRTFSVFSVNFSNTGTELNCRPFLVVGLRMSNALISDEKTRELIDNISSWEKRARTFLAFILPGQNQFRLSIYNDENPNNVGQNAGITNLGMERI